MLEISSKDLLMGHFLIAKRLNTASRLVKGSALHFLSNQLNGSLKNKSSSQKAGFTAYWIVSQKPFEKLNLVSAIIFIEILIGKKLTSTDIMQLHQLLKRSDISVSKIVDFIEELSG